MKKENMKSIPAFTLLMILTAGAACAAPISATISVPVLAHALKAGEIVTNDDLTTAGVNPREVFAGTVRAAAEVVGLKAQRAVGAGVPLNKITFRAVPTVARDSAVSLIYRRPGVELTGSGKALQDGRVGEVIRVLNPASRATVEAVVVGPGMVEVK